MKEIDGAHKIGFPSRSAVPAKAGTHLRAGLDIAMDSCFRRNDSWNAIRN
jgi:hypothetical protein